MNQEVTDQSDEFVHRKLDVILEALARISLFIGERAMARKCKDAIGSENRKGS